MEKVCAAALVATLLAGTAASAQDIRPLEATASTQAQTVVLFGSTLPVGAVVVGTVLVGGLLYQIIEQGDASAASALRRESSTLDNIRVRADRLAVRRRDAARKATSVVEGDVLFGGPGHCVVVPASATSVTGVTAVASLVPTSAAGSVSESTSRHVALVE